MSASSLKRRRMPTGHWLVGRLGTRISDIASPPRSRFYLRALRLRHARGSGNRKTDSTLRRRFQVLQDGVSELVRRELRQEAIGPDLVDHRVVEAAGE